MEYWRQCAMWLISCKVLPVSHRVTADTAQVFDLAQTLRDGVLLCQLLNNLRPHAFLCTHLYEESVFGLKKGDLFDAFDLFDVRDFVKVPASSIQVISVISYLPILQCPSQKVPMSCVQNVLEDEDDLYAAVYGLEQTGGKIYEDLMRAEQQPPLVELDVRSCCLTEIKQTEDKYTETLESIEKYFLIPLKRVLTAPEVEQIFINIPDLVRVHRSLMVDIQESIENRNASNLHQIFINYKERLLIYGVYCSRVEIAIAVLDHICKEKEDVRLKLEECSKRANNGKFTLRDLLVVPMQRILKYHLLLQELVKHTHQAADKSNLNIALSAMKDLAQYINEVKRDNETLREIDQYQRSIENLNQPLITLGRPKGDGEVRMISSVDKRKQDRHIFLFDVALIVCKRRGDNYEMKDMLDLNYFKVTNNPTSEREAKKVREHFDFSLFQSCTVETNTELISNIRPDKANHNSHQFKMHTFEKITSCSFCHYLLLGIFNQGYLCLKCGLGAHKECLSRLGVCGRTGENNGGRNTSRKGLPRMVVTRDYSGMPYPQYGPPLSIHVGDVIEVMFADLHSSWWQGKILGTNKTGFFPSDTVKPCPCVKTDHGCFRFAGPMERYQAEVELLDRENRTFLVRHRSKECTEYAISIKFNDKIKHIKILSKDGCFYIAESRLFRTVLDLVDYYRQHSLKEGFSSLDTTLQKPYREMTNGPSPTDVTNASGVFSPRVVGIAVALYDFCSRDTRQLSLLQGDIIKIYSKMSDGWWKGEVGGRVGLFPSTYVEEED
uniref:Vav 3 guanine nucleotide exchange factor b n=1 Tax=Cynoglossus semilaevis TaxID=244447 RepID=A0A3P8WD14_CYNSE